MDGLQRLWRLRGLLIDHDFRLVVIIVYLSILDKKESVFIG
jgi:hypothetical protein